MHRRVILSALGSTALAALARPLFAQTDAKSMNIICGVPAGGVADFTSRNLAEGITLVSRSPAIVENRVGASGNLAMEHVVKQPADGKTLGLLGSTISTINPFVPQLASKAVDVTRELVPVAAVCDMILLLAVRSDLGVDTLDQFMKKAREPGQRLKIGLAGVGTPHHLAALMLEKAAALDLTLVPYKGGAQMIVNAAGGHIDAVFTTIPVGAPMVSTGKLKWIAIAQDRTLKNLPGIPSLKEIYKGATIPSWMGAFVSAQTPPATQDALNRMINAAANSPDIAAKLSDNGLEPLNLSRDETIAKLSEEAVFMKKFLSTVNLDFSA